ncbi:MAG: hypothetical protein K0M40_07960 [Prolixibacteraceae bacterium]|nr:hypothetical protein [Prolixibacteraceae bacterium]
MKKNILLDYLVFIIAYLWVLYSLNIAIGEHCYDFFSRSGSIIILASGWVELKFISGQIEKMMRYTKEKVNLSSSRLFDALKVDKSDKITRYISYISVLIGTIIWAYGDLILKFLLHKHLV